MAKRYILYEHRQLIGIEMTHENTVSTLEPGAEKRPEIFLPPSPAYLTRFYGNIDYGRDVFQNCSISFVHVSLMNDPFDPYFEFINNFDDRYGAIIKWVDKTYGQKEVRWFRSVMPYNSWVKSVNDIKQKNNVLKSGSFLFCASAPDGAVEPCQNLYMWGHYGAGHGGIAIEFDASRVALSIVEHQTRINPKWQKDQKVWTPVIYQDEVERLTPADFYNFFKTPAEKVLETKLAAQINTVSRTKSTVWKPEQEWRLIWRNDEAVSNIYKVPILPGAIRRVFVGLRVPDALAVEIAAECREAFPGTEIFKGVARPGEFALDFRPI